MTANEDIMTSVKSIFIGKYVLTSMNIYIDHVCRFFLLPLEYRLVFKLIYEIKHAFIGGKFNNQFM